jgi:mannose-6-phosphate isomerase
LGKKLPADGVVAESWEICDRGNEQSVVADGPLAGKTLAEIGREFGKELYGKELFGRDPHDRFPLLIKFLDARLPLSVQVHPNDEQAARLNPPDLGKSEAWIVLAAEPATAIYAGLREGVDRAELAAAVRDGSAEKCLAKIEPRVGDCIYLPAGTVHALGGGLVIAEIQQSSDTTYRLFDWNRVGPDGKPRTLHVDEGLAVTDFSRGPIRVQTPTPTARPFVERLVECPYFVIERIAQPGGTSTAIGGDERFHIMMVLDGQISLDRGRQELLRAGEVVLWPGELPAAAIHCAASSTVLDVFLP